tara:strand:+ start:7020 stop:7565 length:546 start_codon:yes stop_codon:yes gene_type:complete
MAIVNVTAMTELTAPADADVLYIVDDPGSSALPRKITYANIVQKAYGEISVSGASATQSLSATTWTKLTAFTAEGQYKNTTVSHSNDKITAANSGVYLVNATASFTTGAAADCILAVYWDGSITVAKAQRTTASSSDIACVATSALVNASSDAEDFELYAYLSTGTTIVIKDAVLSVVRIG